MAYGTPTDPVGGTVITVAYAVANLLDPIRWLRNLTGNADPPGTAYVVVSTSTTGTSWQKVPGDAIAAGAITDAHLATPKLSLTGGTLSGDLVVSRSGSGAPTTGVVYYGNNSGTTYIFFNGTLFEVRGGRFQVGHDIQAFRAGTPTQGVIYFGLNSDLVFIHFDGTNFNVAAPSGTLQVNGNAVIHAGNIGSQSVASATNAGNVTTSIGGTALASYNAPTATNASQVGGRTPTATPTADAIPIADGSGKLDGWVTPASFSIPSGLGFWVRKAADIPAGFSRDTSLDGLIPIGAGTTFTQTFTEETSYGSSWAHLHNVPSKSVSVTSVSVTGSAVGGPGDSTGGPSSVNGLASAGGVNLPTDAHTHSLNGVSLAVSASGTGSGATAAGNSDNTTWLPPSRAVVWIRKD